MGYTHYWKIPRVLDEKLFKILSEELRTATGLLPTKSKSAQQDNEGVIYLAGGNGEGEPIFDNSKIVFNGQDDLSHETFAILQRGNDDFEFCKTARKPYDLMVCFSLLRLKHHFPEADISSDGGAKDWSAAKKFYKKVFGETPPKVNK